jgi:carboxymethylenebutenolidase
LEKDHKNIYNNDNDNKKQQDASLGLDAVFDEHIQHEFEDKDVDATMKTMTKEPYVYHVPVMTGGVGYEGVYNFYKHHFIGKMPADTKIMRISRTVGKDQVVDELVMSLTHDREIDFLLPGVRPTQKYLQFPVVVVMKFDENGKIAHEHIYWDQASVLAQIGLLDIAYEKGLPITGQEQTAKLIDLSKAARGL